MSNARGGGGANAIIYAPDARGVVDVNEIEDTPSVP